jgi:N-acyl amino acid synthase of PEP-CTERM/exosortase system
VEVAAGQQLDQICFKSCHRNQVGELSRLILAARFRSRKGEHQWPDGLADFVEFNRNQGDRRALVHPVLGLLKAIIMLSWEHQVYFLYTGMEPRLVHRLRQFEFTVMPVSPVIDYHGYCYAYWAYIPAMLARMHDERPDVWALLTDNGQIWPLPSG